MESAVPESDSTTAGPSRRTVVKGAAWSIPVIAAAVAAPLATASTVPAVQPDLAITWLQTGPTNGVVQYWAANGEPGYHAGKQLTYHIQVTNKGDAAATMFVVELQLHAASYQNGSGGIASGSGWEITGVRPSPNTTVTLTLTWTGALEPGQSVDGFVQLRVSNDVPAGETHVTPIAAIVSVAEGDSNSSNNSQVGTPSYWVS